MGVETHKNIHLQAQHFQFPIHVPSNWPDEPSSKAKREVEKRKAKGNAKDEKLPIKILQLPTYASWANPIEKLWRCLVRFNRTFGMGVETHKKMGKTVNHSPAQVKR